MRSLLLFPFFDKTNKESTCSSSLSLQFVVIVPRVSHAHCDCLHVPLRTKASIQSAVHNSERTTIGPHNSLLMVLILGSCMFEHAPFQLNDFPFIQRLSDFSPYTPDLPTYTHMHMDVHVWYHTSIPPFSRHAASRQWFLCYSHHQSARLRIVG